MIAEAMEWTDMVCVLAFFALGAWIVWLDHKE